ncbi:MAG: FKBP-type peptidyl-prolyl cis-trans isomerase [Chryseolinea sp.]
MKKNFVVCLLVALSLGVVSCMNDDESESPQKLLEEQTAAIDEDLASSTKQVVKDISGIRMEIYKLGNGFPAKAGHSVNVDYVGRFFETNGVFDEGTVNQPLAGLIDGWQIALMTLPEGSHATIYLPSIWAYGTKGTANGEIPGNTILKFDLEFNKITRSSAELQKLGSDTVAIDNYLAGKSIVAEKDSTGLRYVITTEGSGPTPGLYDPVTYHAVYRLITDDSKIAAEADLAPTSDYYSRVVDQTADGLKLGLQKLRKGGKATFYVPSLLAFGTNGASSGENVVIPPNSNVVVEVELKEIGSL